jgi:DNA-binding LacI/PurR family transcriptional regulator
MQRRYPEIVALLRQRLRSGDYTVNEFPGERKLAGELGVSYMTARRAVQALVADGDLRRRPSGRVKASKLRSPGKRPLQIGLICPAYYSATSQRWHHHLSQVVAAQGGTVRPVMYLNWHDPAITEALDGAFDGLFIEPPVNWPRVLLDRMAEQRHRVVSLFHDLTHLGIPCIDGEHPADIDLLVEHLRQLGHRRIDCLNTQMLATPIALRIQHWRAALEKHGLHGELHNAPCEPFADATRRAYELAGELLDRGQLACAVFCTHAWIAHGVYRAFYERKVQIGRDVSVCTCDTVEDTGLFTPSLTTLATPIPDDMLALGLDWIRCKGANWGRPMRLAPTQSSLWVGESTGPCPQGRTTIPITRGLSRRGS